MALLGCFLLLSACKSDNQGDALNLDTLIINGKVYAGKNQPASKVAVGVKGDRIVFVGDASTREINAVRTIDAAGKVVSPGLVDPHTHTIEEFTDLRDKSRAANLAYLMQGVTTVFYGNDGFGYIRTGDLIDSLNKRDIGTNVAFFVGLGKVRTQVMKTENRKPTSEELEQMKALVAESMEGGALGFSTGLSYVPDTYADTEEVVALAKVASSYGGVYETHIRDESSYTIGVIEALKEALEISRRADIPLNVAHIKCLGVDVWGKSGEMVRLIEEAQKEGLKVTADQYPWTASGVRIRRALVPPEYLEGGFEEYRKRLQDPELLPEIRTAMTENLRRRGGASSLLFVKSDDKTILGKTLQELSDERGNDPVSTAIDVIVAGSTRVASFNMHEDDIANFMVKPWVMSSSDGNDGHPRKYASYPRKYQNYVKSKAIISEQDFIYRSSGMVADTFKIADRGYLKEGYFADIVIIDPDNYQPVADFKNWNKLSKGVLYALVNGELVIDDGNYIGALAGRALRRAD
ncbi:N-acyl-D-amino-acid deacylase family protein [Porticoccus sp. GXU_MW_L64]